MIADQLGQLRSESAKVGNMLISGTRTNGTGSDRSDPLLDKEAHYPSMLLGGMGEGSTSPDPPAPPPDKPDKRAYTISKQKGKYSPLVKKYREIEAAWTATTETLNRINGQDPAIRDAQASFSVEIDEFLEAINRCATSGTPCTIHGTRSTNKCVSHVSAKADELIARMAQLSRKPTPTELPAP